MPLIQPTLFLTIADRIAAQARTLETAFLSARAVGGGTRYSRIHEGVPFAGDFDVENDLISSANTLDINIQNNPLEANIFGGVISADQRHVQRFGNSNLDAYLSGNQIRVDDGYAHAYNATIGTQLLASDVMAPPQGIGSLIFTASGAATLTVLSATGPGDFTTKHTDNPSTGFTAGLHGPSGMDVIVTSGLSVSGATVNFYMNIIPNQVVTRQVTWSGAELGVYGNIKQIGSGSTDKYLGINTVQVAGGFSGLGLFIVSRVERVPVQ